MSKRDNKRFTDSDRKTAPKRGGKNRRDYGNSSEPARGGRTSAKAGTSGRRISSGRRSSAPARPAGRQGSRRVLGFDMDNREEFRQTEPKAQWRK